MVNATAHISPKARCQEVLPGRDMLRGEKNSKAVADAGESCLTTMSME